MKCVYRELKESVTDTSLPILPVVWEKSYFYQTEANQEIDISSIIPASLKYNTVRVEATVKFASLDNSINSYVVYLRGGAGTVVAYGNEGSAGIWDTYLRVNVSNKVGQDIPFVFDGSTNFVSVGSSTKTGTEPVSNSAIQTGKLLGNASLLTLPKVKEIKIYDQTTQTLVAHLVPAILNNVGVVYDKVSGATLQPSTGSLGID